MSNTSGSKKISYVTIEGKDVLLGRSKLAFDHNTHFHLLIAEHSKTYLSGCRADKTKLVQDLTRDIQSKGGRFLRRCKSTGNWFVVAHREAKEKVGHALRDSSSNKTKCFGQILERSQSLTSTQMETAAIANFSENLSSPKSSPSEKKPRKRRRRKSAAAKQKRSLEQCNDNEREKTALLEIEFNAFNAACADLSVLETKSQHSIDSDDVAIVAEDEVNENASPEMTILSSEFSVVSDSSEGDDPAMITPAKEGQERRDCLPTAANCTQILDLFDEVDVKGSNYDDCDLFSDIDESEGDLDDALDDSLELDFLDTLEDDSFLEEPFRQLQPWDLHINRSTMQLNRFNGTNYYYFTPDAARSA